LVDVRQTGASPVLYYGPGLARYLSAFAWQVQSLDDKAEFCTAVLRV